MKEMWKIYVCIIAKISNDYSKMTYLGHGSVMIMKNLKILEQSDKPHDFVLR